MKLVMDERLKHRLVGLAVVISLGAIFAPAILKQSNQRFDDKRALSVKLPSRPEAPKVVSKNEAALFKRMTVAHVELPSVKDEPKPTTSLARAEPLSQMDDELKPMLAETVKEPAVVSLSVAEKKEEPVLEPKRAVIAPVIVKKAAVVSAVAKKAPARAVASVKKAPVNNNKKSYAVQLGTFSQQKNAVTLVARLKSKGYRSFMVKSSTAKGTVYRVLVGQANERKEASVLQQKLARVEQVKGFVVPTNGLG
ncbi:SPOR domain-containing protein [Legionella sp. CNM-4043-24]|uniref:SPOR domain-containing protein n=1 Tax=Legionella sp. CNM-4043-24 TaxID=3421646 RepID=UPI00403AEF82